MTVTAMATEESPRLVPREVGERLSCVRATIEAPTCSFRYPHFLVGRQPTYDHPPPSTLRGLLAGALGEVQAPPGLQLGTWFQCQGRVDDLEHQHKLKVKWNKKGEVKGDLEVEPVLREALVFPRLELYVASTHTAAWGELRSALLQALRAPAFALSLGRSQDLASCLDVREVELVAAASAYYESTLLPFAWRPVVPRGVTAFLTRSIGPAPARETSFARYVLITDRVYAGLPEDAPAAPGRRIGSSDQVPQLHWVDPQPAKDDRAASPPPGRGVVFHDVDAPPQGPA